MVRESAVRESALSIPLSRDNINKTSMNLEIVDPLAYPGWHELLLRGGDDAFFHSSDWARVLSDSYGYSPIYFAGFNGAQLSFLMPLMEVMSPLTGKRGVSLPFTDSCPPFSVCDIDMKEAAGAAMDYGASADWRYIEWRGADILVGDDPPSEVFFTHDLNLGRTEQDIFTSFKENNKRNIRKALKEGVTISIDQSLKSLHEFYSLNCLTRKRHGLPPQPFSFFKNVHEHIINKGHGMIITANFSGRAIAASVFFHSGTKAIYKYGASDKNYLQLRPNNLVMWEAIKRYRERGYTELNLGRTEIVNAGLLHFKRMWGGKESLLKYHRYDFREAAFLKGRANIAVLSEKLFSRFPIRLLRILGRILYRHFG